MSFEKALQNITSNAALIKPAMLKNVDAAIGKAVRIRGDFPSSLKLQERLGNTVKESNLTVDQLAGYVLEEPFLTLRLLSIVNHDFYSDGRSFSSVHAAVEHLGLRQTPQILKDLAAARNYSAIFLGRSIALTRMQQALIASLLSSGIIGLMTRRTELRERTVIASYLINAGPVLLAYYKPHIYSGISLDCFNEKNIFSKKFMEVMKRSESDLAEYLTEILGLPRELSQIVGYVEGVPWKRKNWGFGNTKEKRAIVYAVYMGNILAHEICNFPGVQGLQALLREFEKNTTLSEPDLEALIGKLAGKYLERCKDLGLTALRVPDYLDWFKRSLKGKSEQVEWPGIAERINPFMYELRACFKTRRREDDFYRLPQAVNCTLHALVQGLNFDRAVLFVRHPKKKVLEIKASLGVKLFSPEKVKRFIEDPDADSMPDIKAVVNRQTVFDGLQIFDDGWPFVAFPIIFRGEVLGVFYADKAKRPDSTALNAQEQVTCMALAEEWQDISPDFA
ncbi:MAG: HDOD domain-containing protein [Candidatus Dadabacteria bacterium]|nr:MAG: HDOD domain-containing protein [Candidatus Dadabacteria bacterium]